MSKKDVPAYIVPPICSNVLVNSPFSQYQGRVTAHATDGFGNVTFVFVEQDSGWKKSKWEFTTHVFVVSQ